MADIKPVFFRWKTADVQTQDGELRRVQVMVPHKRFALLCEQQFDEGEDYALAPIDDIPSKSRAGFFADAGDCYASLPEKDKRFPSFEHFRKMALIQAGWCFHQHYVMSTPDDAKKIYREARRDTYAILKIKGNVVDIWTAKSISGGGLRGKAWQEVKEAALRWAHEQIDRDKYDMRIEEKARKRGLNGGR